MRSSRISGGQCSLLLEELQVGLDDGLIEGLPARGQVEALSGAIAGPVEDVLRCGELDRLGLTAFQQARERRDCGFDQLPWGARPTRRSGCSS